MDKEKENNNQNADYEFALQIHSQLNNISILEQDFLLAQKLHKEWNGPDAMENISLDTSNSMMEDNSIEEYIPATTQRCQTDFYLEELGTYIDLNYNADWQVINALPDVQLIYNQINANIFSLALPVKTILWCNKELIGDLNFKIMLDGSHTIYINQESLVFRPRIDLISVILHIGIHIFLMSKNVSRDDSHDSDFRAIMNAFNQILKCQIHENHSFSPTGIDYKRQWFYCTGICSNYPPFRGVYRSAVGVPGVQNSYFEEHQSKCGGCFFRVFEISRNLSDGSKEIKFVKHVNYMNPSANAQQSRKVNPIREAIDLTGDDNQPGPVVSLVEEIDLLEDSDDETATVKLKTSSTVTKFLENFNRIYNSRGCDAKSHINCPICMTDISRITFVLHLEGCRGPITKIPIKFGK